MVNLFVLRARAQIDLEAHLVRGMVSRHDELRIVGSVHSSHASSPCACEQYLNLAHPDPALLAAETSWMVEEVLLRTFLKAVVEPLWEQFKDEYTHAAMRGWVP